MQAQAQNDADLDSCFVMFVCEVALMEGEKPIDVTIVSLF